MPWSTSWKQERRGGIETNDGAGNRVFPHLKQERRGGIETVTLLNRV